MLQRKPLSKWTGRDLEEWREKLGKLVLLSYEARDGEKARKIVEDYKEGKLTYKEAEVKLKKLAAKAQA
ncbi:MAG: hypothetical protein GSR86_06245 [Desulfurococcales archaeon]|nr:hypothetical protein [Desulfurococcales archaeon]